MALPIRSGVPAISNGSRRASLPPIHVLLVCVLTLQAGAFALWSGGSTSSSVQLYACGVAAILLGGFVFYNHGEGRVTVLGLFGLAMGLLIGLPAWSTAQAAQGDTDRSFIVAVSASLISLTIVSVVAWKNIPCWDVKTLTDAEGRTVAGIGIATYFVATALIGLSSPTVAAIVEGLAFVGVVTLSYGLLYVPGLRIWSVRTFSVGIFVLLYALVNHSGTGRLRIVALACAVLLLLTARFPLKRLKLLILMGTPAALWLLAVSRLRFQESIATGASEGRTGLESLVSTMSVLATVIDAQAEGWPLRAGSSFFSPLFLFVPERFVPSWAPLALGYDLVTLTAPERAGSGFSVAVSVFGEFVWNFGVAGFVLGIPVVAFVLVLADRVVAHVLSKGSFSSASRAVAVLWVVTGVSVVGDLAWNGVHTAVARTGVRAPGLILVSVLLWLLIVSRHHGLGTESRRRP